MGLKRVVLERYARLRERQGVLREVAGCAKGQSLEDRVGWLRRQLERVQRERDQARTRLSEVGNAVQLQRGEEHLVERVAALAKAAEDGVGSVDLRRLKLVERERDEALDRHKAAYERAMGLHELIGAVVEELRREQQPLPKVAATVLAMLNDDQRYAAVAGEYEALRRQCGEWEAEAHQRVEQLTALEDRMDQAAGMVRHWHYGGAAPSAGEVRHVLSLLARGEDQAAGTTAREAAVE